MTNLKKCAFPSFCNDKAFNVRPEGIRAIWEFILQALVLHHFLKGSKIVDAYQRKDQCIPESRLTSCLPTFLL